MVRKKVIVIYEFVLTDLADEYLTRAQRRILRCLLRKMNLQEIADEYHLSFWTIKKEYETLSIALECDDKGDLIVTAFAAGIIRWEKKV